jgi:gluconokinase
MGIYKSLDDAAQTVELPDVYKPNKQHHAIYADYFGLFEKLSVKLVDEFEAIGNLQHKYAVQDEPARHKKELINRRTVSKR